MNKQLGPQIKALRQQGLSYSQIAKQLNCKTSTISYHLSKSTNSRTRARNKASYYGIHPLERKTTNFLRRKQISTNRPISAKKLEILFQARIRKFINRKGANMPSIPFTAQDVIDKFNNNFYCYLTGDSIDITKSKTYHFDHILPVSRGGTNSLDNLGICTTEANLAKHDKTPDEFLNLCRKVLEHHGYKVALHGVEPNSSA